MYLTNAECIYARYKRFYFCIYVWFMFLKLKSKSKSLVSGKYKYFSLRNIIKILSFLIKPIGLWSYNKLSMYRINEKLEIWICTSNGKLRKQPTFVVAMVIQRLITMIKKNIRFEFIFHSRGNWIMKFILHRRSKFHLVIVLTEIKLIIGS